MYDVTKQNSVPIAWMPQSSLPWQVQRSPVRSYVWQLVGWFPQRLSADTPSRTVCNPTPTRHSWHCSLFPHTVWAGEVMSGRWWLYTVLLDCFASITNIISQKPNLYMTSQSLQTHDLRGYVIRCAQDRVGLLIGRWENLGDTEITQLDTPLFREEHIRSFKIPVCVSGRCEDVWGVGVWTHRWRILWSCRYFIASTISANVLSTSCSGSGFVFCRRNCAKFL